MTLRPKSKTRQARAKYPSAAQLEERREWRAQFDCCWICGTRANPQTHELASRAQAPNKWADVRNYFACCGVCNVCVLNNLPENVQLAYKRHFDFENYDRVLVNQLRGRAPDAISEGDVRGWSDFVKAIT